MAVTNNFAAAASLIGCTEPAIRAVFRAEAAGKYFNADGSIVQRFEPHHFHDEDWAELGFNPRSKALYAKAVAAGRLKPGAKMKPWLASYMLSNEARRRMFATAKIIDYEAAMQATSHGAPQIMGFNHQIVGYESASAMVEGFKDAAAQVIAFARFVKKQGLDSDLRTQDWLGFAKGYNGTGQAAHYAALIERYYREESGEASAVVLRVGSTGKSVEILQHALIDAGVLKGVADGAFGNQTRVAVVEFQQAHDLKADGVVGAQTWGALDPFIKDKPAEQQPSKGQIDIVATAKVVSTAAGSAGTAAGVLLKFEGWAQYMLIGTICVLVVGAAAVMAVRTLRRTD